MTWPPLPRLPACGSPQPYIVLSGLISQQLHSVPAISTIPPATVADIADYGQLFKMKGKMLQSRESHIITNSKHTRTHTQTHTHTTQSQPVPLGEAEAIEPYASVQRGSSDKEGKLAKSPDEISLEPLAQLH